MNDDNENNLIEDTTKDELAEAKQRRAEAQNTIGGQALRRAGNAAKNGVKRAGRAIKEKVAQVASKFSIKLGASILTVVIVIVVAIGLISFILNAPALIKGKITEFVDTVFSTSEKLFYGENAKLSVVALDKEKRLELLNYISSDMGLDVIGLGFVPVATYSNSEDDLGKQKITDYESTIGIMNTIQNENDKISKYSSNADADLIYYYLMANERAYVLNSAGIFGTLFGSGTKWEGMLNINESILDSIEIDRDNKLLKIANRNSHWGELLNKDQFSFSLDGWTGRYGTPFEFSLALHLSTMSPNMVKEMLTNEDLQTQVYINLQKADCDISFKFYVKETGKEINIPFNPSDGNVNSLYQKLQNKQDINEEDLSIRGIVEASKMYIGNYVLNEQAISGGDDSLTGISRHLDTINAILGTNDFVVKIEDTRSGSNELQTASSGQKIYSSEGTLSPATFSEVNSLVGEYNLTSGAYVCSYDNSGNVNTNSGKLQADYYLDLNSNGIAQNYELVYKLKEDNENYYVYEVYFNRYGGDSKETNSTNEGYIGGMQYVPKNYNGLVIRADTGGSVTNARVKPISNIYEDGQINMAEMVSITKDEQCYRKMFEEIDWFLGTIHTTYNGLNYNKPNIYYNSISDYYFYTTKFNEFMELVKSSNFWTDESKQNEAKEKYSELMNLLKEDYNYLISQATPGEEGKKVINQLLKKMCNTDVTVDDLITIVKSFGGNADVDNSDVEYSQPRIIGVMKHWFKDIDYSYAYTEDYSPITITYTGEDIKGLQVDAILTPKGNDYLYKQTSQPYVIKGDVVLLDGKIQGSTQDIYGDNEPLLGYKFGDGYRATKKIFTQGFYYTFDGSAETSKSIFWQQQLEDIAQEGEYFVAVANGRVVYISSNKLEIKKYEQITTDSEGNALNLPAGVIIHSAGEQTKTDGKLNSGYFATLSEGTLVKYYYIKIDDISKVKYLSPASNGNTYEAVQTRVNEINAMWKAIGVTSLRQHLSFDNTTSSGEVMANTGLSILKNCDTDDADYIYRDLKEMLMDLGYYTQAEFDMLDSAVLKWFIPSYIPDKWPQNTVEDFSFAAVIYPSEKKDEETETNSSEENVEDGETEGSLTISEKAEGFSEGLDVVAPGDCRILSYDEAQKTIELEFNGVSQPQISMLNGYTMTISGIEIETSIETKEHGKVSIQSAIENGYIIEVGAKIGLTGTEKISVTLCNDIGRLLSNVEDYMKAPAFMAYSGKLSEQFYYYLAEMEGVSSNIEGNYFLGVGGSDNNSGYITVGPGLLMDEGKVELYKSKGGAVSDGMNKQKGSKWDIQIIMEMYVELIDTNFLAQVEDKLDGYKIAQTQMEALVLTAYQRGTGSGDLIKIINLIKTGASADKLYNTWVVPWRNDYSSSNPNPGVYARRYSEWYLYKYGTYINAYSNKISGKADTEYKFESETPFQDLLEDLLK